MAIRLPPGRNGTTFMAAASSRRSLRSPSPQSTLAQDGAQYSDNPTFRKEFQRIVEGARTAGLPER